MLGNIFSKVYAGEIQGESLGLDVDIYNQKGKKVYGNKKGELVIKKPFPTMPIKFWNDKNDQKFKKASVFCVIINNDHKMLSFAGVL